MVSDKPLDYYYHFYFSDKSNFEFKISIDKEKKLFINEKETPEEFKKFTDLENNKCSNCPLNQKEFPECPVAKNILSITNYAYKGISNKNIRNELKILQKSKYSKNVEIRKRIENNYDKIYIFHT